MKKLLIALAAMLVLVSCDQGQNNNVQNTNTSETGTASVGNPGVSLNVAYINIDSLMQEYTLAEELMNQFQAKYNKAEREMNAKYQRLERDMMDAQEKIQKGLVTRATAAEMEQKLVKQQQDLMAAQERVMGELAEEEKVMMNRLYYAVMDYLEEYNADYRYSMIISTSASGPILHADPSMNITQEVLEALNKIHAAEKAAEN